MKVGYELGVTLAAVGLKSPSPGTPSHPLPLAEKNALPRAALPSRCGERAAGRVVVAE